MKRFFEFLFIGISLQSYYFYGIGLPLVSIVSLMLLTFAVIGAIDDPFVFPLNAASAVAVGLMVIFLWSIIGLLWYGDAYDRKRLLGFCVIIAGALVAVMLYRRVPLEELIRTFLVFHITFFFIQFFIYYVTGYAVDFLAPVTGEEQRMFGGTFSFPLLNRFIRPSGLFSEPGGYATFVAPFVALFGRWYERSTLNRRVYWWSLASLVLSLSVFGIVFAGMIVMLASHLKRRQRAAAIVGAAVLAAPFLYYRFVLRPRLGLDTGAEFRQVFLERSFEFLWSDPIGFAFGANLLVLDPRAEFIGALNDVGLIFYFLHFAGPFATIVVVGVLAFVALKRDQAARTALLIILASKHSIFAPFFPFTLVAALWSVTESVPSPAAALSPLGSPGPPLSHADPARHHRAE